MVQAYRGAYYRNITVTIYLPDHIHFPLYSRKRPEANQVRSGRGEFNLRQHEGQPLRTDQFGGEFAAQGAGENAGKGESQPSVTIRETGGIFAPEAVE